MSCTICGMIKSLESVAGAPKCMTTHLKLLLPVGPLCRGVERAASPPDHGVSGRGSVVVGPVLGPARRCLLLLGAHSLLHPCAPHGLRLLRTGGGESSLCFVAAAPCLWGWQQTSSARCQHDPHDVHTPNMAYSEVVVNHATALEPLLLVCLVVLIYLKPRSLPACSLHITLA